MATPCWNMYFAELLFLTVVGAASAWSASAALPDNLWTEAWAYHGINPANVTSADVQVSTDVVLAAKGFHSHIQYTVNRQQASEHNVCQMMVLQPLPAGVYADPYELANIAGMSSTAVANQLQLSSYRVFGKIDVERIEPDCEPTLLSVSANIDTQLGTVNTATATILHLKVPLHARYPAPHPAGDLLPAHPSYHNYSLEGPTVVLRCSATTSHQANGETRLCQDVCHISSAKHELSWTLPAGLTKHTWFVQTATSAVAVGSLTFLLIAVYTHAQDHTKATLPKQE